MASCSCTTSLRLSPSGNGAIQRELHRPEGGTWILLSDGDRRGGRADTGGGDRVLPGRRHLLDAAKTPERPVQRPYIGKEDWTRH